MNEYLKKTEEMDAGMHNGVSYDTVKREITLENGKNAAVYCVNGCVDSELIEKLIRTILDGQPPEKLPFADMSVKMSAKEALIDVYTGNAIVIFEGTSGFVSVDVKAMPLRSIEEPSKEKVLRGAKDGFVESIVQNSALIRRRIRDSKLIFKRLSVGKSSVTDVAICYMEDRADSRFVNKLISEIDSIDIGALNMGQESLAELMIKKKKYNPFPKIRYTERPDAAAAMLMEGSVIVLCDNYPAAMILPTSFLDFLQNTDDFYFPPAIGGYLKVVRNVVYLFSIILTPVWFCLQQYADIIPEPLSFLIYKGESFLPLLFQILLVELAVDGLKLASLNTPDTLSNSLSVISALILGDFAIEVGWISEQVILYMAFVAIANFAQPSYELSYAFKFMRMITLLLIALFGIYGLAVGVIFTITTIVTNGSYLSGKGYLYPLIPFNGKALFKLLYRVSTEKDKSLKK